MLCFVFVFFGGWMLFDFSKHLWLATAACALIIAAIVSLFIKQDDKIEQLEKRVEALEGNAKPDTALSDSPEE